MVSGLALNRGQDFTRKEEGAMVPQAAPPLTKNVEVWI